MIFIELYSYFLITLSIISIILAYPLFNKPMEGSKTFGLLLISMAIWSFGYGMEITQKELPEIIKWIKVEYIGIATLPSLWLVFTLYYSNNQNLLKRKGIKAFVITMPLITFFLVATNEFHHLHFSSIELNTKYKDIYLAKLTPGFWYVFFTIYFYVLLIYGLWNLYLAYKNSSKYFKIQSYSILIAALIPWLVNVFYVIGIRPFEDLDLTPGGFLISSIFIGISLYRFKLFDIVPLAKENILESLSDGIIVLNDHLEILYLNNPIIDFLGITKNKNILSKSLKTIHLQLFNVLEKNKNIESFSISLDIINENGTKNFIISKNKINKLDKNNTAIVVYIKEITSLKGIEKSLKLSENKFTTLFNNIKDIFIILDKDGNIEEISPSIERETGYLREEIIGKLFFKFIDGHISEARKNFIENEYIDNLDFKIKNIWNKQIYVSFNGQKRFENGEFKGYEGIIRNITERINHKKILEENQSKLTEAQKIAQLAYWEYDFQSKEMKWSEAMFSLFGITKNHFNPSIENFSNIFEPIYKKAFFDSLELSQTIKSTTWNFCAMNKKSQELRYFTAVNRYTEHENTQKIFGIVMDVTTLKITEEKLIQQNQYLREIAQMQSHEVRRPLTSILGLIELIEEQELNREMKELIVNLKIASNQLDEIIHDIVKRTRNY